MCKDVQYSLIQSMTVSEELGKCAVYGIQGACRSGQNTDCVRIQDITSVRDRAERICQSLTDHQVSLIHMKDVIEDLMYDWYEI